MERLVARIAVASLGLAAQYAFASGVAAILPSKAIGAVLTQGMKDKDAKQKAAKVLAEKMKEMRELRSEASAVSEKIAGLKLDSATVKSDEGIAAMKALTQELQQVNDRLKKLEEQMEEVLGWIADQSQENIPVMQNDIANLKKAGITNYVQFQWSNTDEDTGQTTNDGLQLRRFRIGQKNKLDDKTSTKLSFDVATGSSRLAAELKDAQLIYDFKPSDTEFGGQVIAGQQPLPLGYELERSSSEREFPERARYNTTLFAGERDRGLLLKYGLGPGIIGHFGIWQGMTVTDPQQSADGFRDADNKIGWTAGIRAEGHNFDIGISTFQAERPRFTETNDGNGNDVIPAVKRSMFYLDGTYLLSPQVTLRGELMWGQDRPPTGGKTNPIFESATDVLGWQAQITFNATKRNQFHARYQFFDPDTRSSAAPANSVKGWGLGYTYWMNSHAKLTLSYEMFDEQGAEIRNNVWTLRYQFKL